MERLVLCICLSNKNVWSFIDILAATRVDQQTTCTSSGSASNVHVCLSETKVCVYSEISTFVSVFFTISVARGTTHCQWQPRSKREHSTQFSSTVGILFYPQTKCPVWAPIRQREISHGYPCCMSKSGIVTSILACIIRNWM